MSRPDLVENPSECVVVNVVFEHRRVAARDVFDQLRRRIAVVRLVYPVLIGAPTGHAFAL